MAWIWNFVQKNITSEEFWQAVVRRNNKREVVYIRKKTSKFNEKKINLYLLARKRKIQQARYEEKKLPNMKAFPVKVLYL